MSKSGLGRGKKRTKKARAGKWIFFAVITTLNLIISVLMRISDRKNAIAAIKKDENLSLLYTGEKTTKIL